MKKVIHSANSRGHANHGWLDSFHSFSFAGYHNDSKMHFGLLRVLNDDVVAEKMGFGQHPHDNMEIVSIPLSGALHHLDNTGRSEIIRSGDVQIMSAGSGIVHSEMNASQTEPVNFLQLWVFPQKRNIEPRYEQKTFDKSERKNKFQTVVSPDGEGVWINQQAWFSLIDMDKKSTADYSKRNTDNGAYIFLLEGDVIIDGEKLTKRDAIGIWDFDAVKINAHEDAQLLIVDVPMN